MQMNLTLPKWLTSLPCHHILDLTKHHKNVVEWPNLLSNFKCWYQMIMFYDINCFYCKNVCERTAPCLTLGRSGPYTEKKIKRTFFNGLNFCLTPQRGAGKILPSQEALFISATLIVCALDYIGTARHWVRKLDSEWNWLRMGHFHLQGFIKPRIGASVIIWDMGIADTFHSNQEYLPRASLSLTESTMGMLQTWLRTCRWHQTFQCATHNKSVVETSPTKYLGYMEPSTCWATSRNHVIKGLAYSPQTPLCSVETIYKNCCRNTRTP